MEKHFISGYTERFTTKHICGIGVDCDNDKIVYLINPHINSTETKIVNSYDELIAEYVAQKIST